MKRIQSEITSFEIADQWQSKLEAMGAIFNHFTELIFFIFNNLRI